MRDSVYPPKRFAKSIASSRPRDVNSPVNTKVNPAKQLGSPSGIAFVPGCEGPAALRAATAM